ncbi:FAD-binding oxidoreductase [Paraliobacillus sp. JSM ZJ581]|uniref:FAD-binding oxidoreductase n=1 Tax=Paraliobacillus sp. JSM ZJ581 TaxID=3342118 RepID=UPI0035A8F525
MVQPQFITVKVDIPSIPYTCQRQYSLSCKPNSDYFHISVKREDGLNDNPNGVVSTYLHESVHEGDAIEISAPAGDFVLDKEQKPLILLSGGVGLTPLTSMLHTVAHQQPEREVYYIHAAQNGDMHAYTVYEKGETTDCDKVGLVDLPWLQSILPTNNASFYFCGPAPFMKAMNKALLDWNVKEEDIHFEFFGPQGDLA